MTANVAQVANRKTGCAEVKVDQIGGMFALNIPSHLFRNRIDFERFDKGSGGVRQTVRNRTIQQRFSISEIKHCPGHPCCVL
jgi:hypothetical protein